MNKVEATVLLASLWDRIERSPQSGKWNLNGPISDLERAALAEALTSFGVDVEAKAGVRVEEAKKIVVNRPPVKLELSATGLSAPQDEDVVLCIDFGTAMSKAFAICGNDRLPLDLALGKRSGYTEAVYPVPSSLFISTNGRMYFGHEAIAQSFLDPNPERERFDSPKQILSQGSLADLKNAPVSSRTNPTSVQLTQGDLILAYLAYLTDLAGLELESRGKSRYVKRRFAHPCWDKDRMKWAHDFLSEMLASAQILADTFSGRWQGGLNVHDLRSAIDGLSSVQMPSHLIAGGVHEPVAAAASVIVRPGQHRLGFVVVDIGAGTTDFGLFVASNLNGTENFFQAGNSIRSVRQAGDTIDNCLRKAILERHHVDRGSAYGKRLSVDLTLKIRQYKERLFRDGSLSYELADDTTGTVRLDEFLQTDAVLNFRSNLQTELSKTLTGIDRSWIENLAAKQGLRFVLTGGGARLPMVQEMATGTVTVNGITVECRKPESEVPDWIKSSYPAFEPEYPQLAVAMGGAMPDLPTIRNVFDTYGGGLSHPTVVAGNLRISGT